MSEKSKKNGSDSHEDLSYEERFVRRLSALRYAKGVSARDMSLSIGQNPGYINNIETGKSLPSLTGFFYICDYLEITPKDFFDEELAAPDLYTPLIEMLHKLNREQLEVLLAFLRAFL